MWRVIAVVLVVCLSACHPVETAQPQALYDLARQAIDRDELTEALALAQRGMFRWDEGAASPWHWSFGYLCAEIYFKQGLLTEASALLAVDFPDRDAFPSIELDRIWLSALITERTTGWEEALVLLDKGFQMATDHGQNEYIVRFYAKKIWPRVGDDDCDQAVRADYANLRDLAARLGDKVFMALAQNRQGFCHMREHRYHEALGYFQKVLETRVAAYRSTALLNLGVCYGRLGYYQKALDCLEDSIAANRDDSDDLQGARGEIGNIYLFQGDFKMAQQYYREALALAEQIQHEDSVKWLGNLAMAHVSLGEWDLAEYYNDKAVAVTNQEAQAHLALNAALIAQGRGQFTPARDVFFEVAQSSDPSLQWSAHDGLARLEKEKGNIAKAIFHFEKATGIIEDNTEKLIDPELEIMFFARLIRVYQEYVETLVEQGEDDRALEVVEASRARILARKYGGSRVEAAALQALARRTENIYLSYWLAPGRSFLWVIDGRTAAPERYLLPDEMTITKRVTGYQRQIEDRSDPLSVPSKDGAWLYENLLPAEIRTRFSGRRIVIVPDQALCGLNFEALPVYQGDRPQYWIERVAGIAVAPSLAVNANQGPPPATLPQENSLLVIGDPLEEDADAFPGLPNAHTEIQSLVQAFPQNKQLTAEKACPEAYFQGDPGQYDLIHFAAHVEPNGTHPLYSAVVLSRCSDVGFKLIARDVLEPSLDARVVTISSCRSSGTPRPGEGLVGLAWAFLSAGARNVVAALWNVNDKVAPRIMAIFYEGLAADSTPMEALHEAKLKLIREPGKTNYHKPYYWAPFQVYIGKSR